MNFLGRSRDVEFGVRNQLSTSILSGRSATVGKSNARFETHRGKRFYFLDTSRSNFQILFFQEVMKKFPRGPPLLDPVEDMKIKEPGLKEAVKKIETYQDRLMGHSLRKNPNLDEICKIYEEKLQVIFKVIVFEIFIEFFYFRWKKN